MQLFVCSLFVCSNKVVLEAVDWHKNCENVHFRLSIPELVAVAVARLQGPGKEDATHQIPRCFNCYQRFFRH